MKLPLLLFVMIGVLTANCRDLYDRLEAQEDTTNRTPTGQEDIARLNEIRNDKVNLERRGGSTRRLVKQLLELVETLYQNLTITNSVKEQYLKSIGALNIGQDRKLNSIESSITNQDTKLDSIEDLAEQEESMLNSLNTSIVNQTPKLKSIRAGIANLNTDKVAMSSLLNLVPLENED